MRSAVSGPGEATGSKAGLPAAAWPGCGAGRGVLFTGTGGAPGLGAGGGLGGGCGPGGGLGTPLPPNQAVSVCAAGLLFRASLGSLAPPPPTYGSQCHQ